MLLDIRLNPTFPKWTARSPLIDANVAGFRSNRKAASPRKNRCLVLSRYRATTGSNTERQLGIGGASTEMLKTNFVEMSELRMSPTHCPGPSLHYG